MSAYRLRLPLLCTGLILAWALPAGAAAAGPGDLSPRLAALSTPAVRALGPEQRAQRLGVAQEGPGSLIYAGGRVLADVHFSGPAASAAEGLGQAGAEVLALSNRYRTATVAVAPAALPALGAAPQVSGVVEDLAPIVRATCPSGAVVSEGDAELGAAGARAAYGVDGSGVRVGILSDSFDQNPGAATHASGDVASGDLPGSGNPCGFATPVTPVGSQLAGEGTDEGRAMAQIVHDLAPGAAIDFASAVTGELEFAENIRRLAARGDQVIADDVAYLEEPFFQDGPVAVAVDEAAAAGVDYFSAAGNDNLFDAATHSKEIASWEAPAYRDTPCPGGVPSYAVSCMNFSPAGTDNGFGITVEGGATLTLDLQWAQPWNGVATDLDAYVVSGGKVLARSESPNTDSSFSEPVELLSWENPGGPKNVEVVIDRCDAACGTARALAHPKELAGTTGGDSGAPRLKLELLENGGGVSATEYPESSGGDVVGPTVFGHAGASGAIAVGAVPFSNANALEPYSSRGPVTHYFGPVIGTSAAAAIAPQTIDKPDVVATDCGATTFFARLSKGVWRFCGTSAAAPHAAAVAALARQLAPAASGAQVREALSATARPLGGLGREQVGAGLLDASAALAALAPPPLLTITRRPAQLSRVRRPSFEFTANRPVSFTCALDGAAPQACSSPFTVPAPLRDGRHRFVLSASGADGRPTSAPAVEFRIDATPPRTAIVSHPHRLLVTHHRRALAAFRFRSNEAGSTFLCKLDRRATRRCHPRLLLHLAPGAHLLRVRARDQAGNVDPSPAVFRFRVRRVG